MRKFEKTSIYFKNVGDMSEQSEILMKRTKTFAHSCVILASELPKNNLGWHLQKQLIRCSTSVAANFRAVCIARSIKERYSKFCIVVEEADETVFWLELLEESHLNIKVPEFIKREALELSKVIASCKKGLKTKL